MAEIWELSAAEVASEVRLRRLSPVEVVQALLARTEQVEPALRAWETLDPAGALAAAEQLSRLLAAGEDVGPLAGVPFGIKDLYDVAGLPTTAGSPLLASNIATDDATAVARLRAAGGVVLGKTVTTAFAYADPPPTRNPWNLAHTPGGSSSGSAAAVAARMVPAALGTQTAGSGLRPAAYCGVVGFKPSYDRVSRRGIRPLSWSLDTLAVHARSVADVDLVLGALGGGMASASASVKGARLGLVTELVDLAEPELAQRINDTAVQMAGCGATVAEVRLPYANADMLAVHHVVQQVEAVAAHRPLFSRHADGYPPRLRAYLEVGQFLPASAYIEAQRLRRRMFDAIDSLFEGVDALLLPTARGPAPEASTTGSYVMLAAWSLLGLPAITIPAGLSATNLPLAIQLVGRHGADAALLHVAELCETVIGRLGVPDLSAEIQRAIA